MNWLSIALESLDAEPTGSAISIDDSPSPKSQPPKATGLNSSFRASMKSYPCVEEHSMQKDQILINARAT